MLDPRHEGPFQLPSLFLLDLSQTLNDETEGDLTNGEGGGLESLDQPVVMCRMFTTAVTAATEHQCLLLLRKRKGRFFLRVLLTGSFVETTCRRRRTAGRGGQFSFSGTGGFTGGCRRRTRLALSLSKHPEPNASGRLVSS